MTNKYKLEDFKQWLEAKGINEKNSGGFFLLFNKTESYSIREGVLFYEDGNLSEYCSDHVMSKEFNAWKEQIEEAKKKKKWQLT